MTSATTTRRAGIIGWPVEHSKSPVVHSYWLDHYSVEGSYVRLPVRPKELADALNSLAQRGFVGINITLPHKERALEFVDEVSPEAQRIGAANTIFVNERGRLLATNTDAYGFLANLRAEAPEFDVAEAPAVVVGAGGASRAVCVALQDAGVPEIYLVNRTESRAESIAESLGGNVKVISWNELVTNKAPALSNKYPLSGSNIAGHIVRAISPCHGVPPRAQFPRTTHSKKNLTP